MKLSSYRCARVLLSLPPPSSRFQDPSRARPGRHRRREAAAVPAVQDRRLQLHGRPLSPEAGKSYTAKFDLTMSPSFPPVTAKAVFKGQDAAGEFFCFRVPVELKH
ncbi:hypothetical protein HPB48_012427 [Haemaphysalis longicornis]|uniref:Uncharacterized protein n=1 Tax=Haemaphysalis longicornis TaxID=44386 RepID=A0A9J6FRC4_HAELO|nr:hypothetical protein HPB48_012427 [Haemaphysalis longicornis]